MSSLVVQATLEIPFWMASVMKVLAVALIIPVGALLLGWLFLFKVMSHMQSRLGPMEAGPHGTLQLVADGVKFIQKEDIIPDGADKRIFALAPLIVMISTFLLFVVIPAGPTLVATGQTADGAGAGIFLALAVSSLSVLGVMMAGWASANKYALMGGLRAAGQLVAYELPMVLAVVGVIIQAGSLSLQDITTAQAQGEIFGIGLIGNPFIITQCIGFLLFMIGAQAELTQTPFDMPVAESELVAGYMVEYSGFRFLFFYMAETATAFAFSAIAAVLFLGGWSVPFIDVATRVTLPVLGSVPLMDILGPPVLLAKILLVAFLIFWIRFTYPRLREDQLQQIAWKYLIPLSLVNILVTAAFKVAF